MLEAADGELVWVGLVSTASRERGLVLERTGMAAVSAGRVCIVRDCARRYSTKAEQAVVKGGGRLGWSMWCKVEGSIG